MDTFGQPNFKDTLARRTFLSNTATGIGALALRSLLVGDGLASPSRSEASPSESRSLNPLQPRPPHFAPRAKNCIFIFMEGGASHMDLFDPKPKLNELDGQPLPESLLESVRFAFIQKEGARLMGTPRTFKKHGDCGMDFSDLLPRLATCADDLLMVRSLHCEQFNHHPAQLLMQCGRPELGLPALGSWVTYGLGNESQNLPAYVVLNSGQPAAGGATIWQSGFLPSNYAGVKFRNDAEPVLNLKNPPGLPSELQRKRLDVLRRMNTEHYEEMQDPEIASRISNYELAFRMQMETPELIDFRDEPRHILDEYGVDRPEPKGMGGRGKLGDTHKSFARNCLLARRMVERGVRFVNIIYSRWDHHSKINEELPYNCSVVDQPLTALITDLKRRGLLDDTLVVWGGEFGRTPLGENRPGRKVTGRDHHPFAFTSLLTGGGVRGGKIYGETDEIGWGVTQNPVHVNDYHATLLHLFGLDHLKLTYRFQGREYRLTDVGGNVVSEWLA